jgi:hypothetical protein
MMNRRRLEQLHEEGGVFLTDGAGDEWSAWRVEFTQLWSPLAVESPNFFHDHCVALLEGSESLAAAFTSLVPSSVTEESFWCRYLHARRCIVPNELALFVLEGDPATFTSEPNDVDFDNWKDSFFSDWDQVHRDVAADCEVALEKSQLLSWQHARLVPASVSARDFWCRYLYRRAVLVRNFSKFEHDQSSARFASPVQAHAAENAPVTSESEGIHATDDVSVLPLPQMAASTTSCDASLSGDVVSPTEIRASPSASSSTLTDNPQGYTHAAENAPVTSESEGIHVADDVSVFPLPQMAASTTSCEASLSGDVVSPTEIRASPSASSSTLTDISRTSSESAAPACHDVPSSSCVASQGPSSLEADGWDEWE